MQISKLKSIKKIPYSGKVYDLCFKNEHYFFCRKKNESTFNVLVHNSMVDIDVDFMADTDNEVDDFLDKKYGKERVLKVCTFGTFSERNTLKDVVRAFRGAEATGFYSDVDYTTKEMPNFNKVDFNLKTWFEEWPKDDGCSDVVRNFLTDPNNKTILEYTLKLQGQIRGVSQHAAGVVILPGPSWKYIPTNIIGSNKNIVTAFQEADKSGKDLSELQILKLDRLKLATINIIQDTIKLVKKNKNIDITNDIDNIDIFNPDLYDELKKKLNHGIFQFESPGINKLVSDMYIDNFEELYAASALYRPGPLGIGAHEEYIKNKFNPEQIKYLHPVLEPILKETKGVFIFQEQLMFIANKIGEYIDENGNKAGMSLGLGDMLRKSMDKAGKLIDLDSKGELSDEDRASEKFQDFLKYWNIFLDGAEKNGYQREEIDALKNWIIKYLGYSFNKSHSVSYSYLTLQTLYLKRYYSTEFYTALLNNSKSSGDKEDKDAWLADCVTSAMSKGIEIKPPSLKSEWKYTVTGENEITMGFSSINGFGEIAYSELMELIKKTGKTLETISMSEFFNMPFSKFNKGAFESCVKAGVFDNFSTSREFLYSLKNKKKSKVDTQQRVLWDLAQMSESVLKNNGKFPDTTIEEMNSNFEEVCGFSLNKIKTISKLKLKLYEKAGRPINDILHFSDSDYYFFVLESFKIKKSTSGSDYLEMRVTSGTSSKAKIIRAFDPTCKNIKDKLMSNAIYIAEFEKNEKGFVNFKKNGKFKRLV